MSAFLCAVVALLIPYMNSRRIIETEEVQAVNTAVCPTTMVMLEAAFETLAALLINLGAAAVLG